MIKILFVCHGNICRSPMSEYLLKDLVEKQNLTSHFEIASAATSSEEIWNGTGTDLPAGAGGAEEAWDRENSIHEFFKKTCTAGNKRRLRVL